MAEDARATEPMPLGAKLWVAGLCVMLLAAGGVHLLGRNGPKTVAMVTIEGIENLSGLDLPEQARIVNARYSAPFLSQGRMAWAVLRMPKEDALALLQSEAFGDTFSREERILESPYGDTGEFFGEQIADWHPEDAEEVASGSTNARADEGPYWGTMAQADLDHPQRAIVYLLMQR